MCKSLILNELVFALLFSNAKFIGRGLFLIKIKEKLRMKMG